MDYRRSLAVFDAFLADAAEEAHLTTRNQSYTMVQAVFQTFRRRLTHEQSIIFLQALPAMLRALYVTDWDPKEPLVTDWNRQVMTKEVQSLRRDHNFSPDTAIRDVARAIRRYVDHRVFNARLAILPLSARRFWATDPY